MKRKLLFFIICLMTINFANAKKPPLHSIEKKNSAFLTISIFGDATPGAWTTDTDMTTTDGTTYTLNGVALIPGALKFRGNHEWTLPYNWGGTAFPSGTAVVDANGITIPTAGNYDITFNISTGAYSFAVSQISFQVISIFGDATPGAWTTDTDMNTTDGTTYTLKNVALVPGALKFRGDHAWTLPYNWGGTAFPSGTAVVDADPISIPTAGLYNISFNKTTGAYSFTFQTISIFGDATPGAWTTDTDMTTTDGTIYTLNGVSLVPGALKFRGDHAWTLPYNWGGTDFPSGTAVVDADPITVPTAGVYNISFNKVTGVYSIAVPIVNYQVISIFGDATPGGWVTDTDMTTTDGTIYTLYNTTLIPGALKFRGDHAWTLPYNWGGTAFPSGTAVVDADPIPVPTAGNYDITFNKTTGDYSFTVSQVISIFGDATPGAWTTDTDMTTSNGIDYTLNGVSLVAGALKFRGDHAWTLPYNWGGTAFPSGTAVVDAAPISIPAAGVYNISFNKVTGVYSFTIAPVTFQVISIFGDATPGAWTTDTDMSTTDGTTYTLKNVALVPGALKFRGDHAWTLPYNWGGTDFPSGTAVIDANGITIPTAGLYTITFNKVTGTYSFTFQTISIFGDATPGAWVTDTDMTTLNGIDYTLNGVSLVPGALKFRGDHAWTLPYNWGGTDLPSGTAVIDGNGITIPTAGDYTISFNKVTGVYYIAIPNAPTELSYTTPAVFVTNTAITNLVPSVKEGLGNIVYSVSPSLPEGLLLNDVTGIISGTPTSIQSATAYTVSATNSYGFSSKIISIEIQGVPTDLIYGGNLRLPINIVIETVSPTITSNPAPVFSISPALPTGMILNTATGAISGRPTVETTVINYTVTATNTVGAQSQSFTIEVYNEDHDFDGILDVNDNCPTTYNQDQSDIDNDGIGDSCDLDEINVAQGFSPNGDRVNDTWFINNLVNHPNSSVRVFNKIGAEVYFSKNYQNDWNGEYKNTGEIVAAGSYFYQIDLGGDGSIDQQGWIYIAK